MIYLEVCQTSKKIDVQAKKWFSYKKKRVPGALCNNNLSHFVIKLLFCTLHFVICQKRLQNWTALLCNKIVISIYLSYLPGSYLYFHKNYDCHTWKAGEFSWRTTSNKVTWPFDHMVRWSSDKWKTLFPLPRSLWLLNLTGR